MMGNLRTYYNFSLFKLGLFVSSQDCYGQLVITNQGGTAQDIVRCDGWVWIGLLVMQQYHVQVIHMGTFTNGETTCA